MFKERGGAAWRGALFTIISVLIVVLINASIGGARDAQSAPGKAQPKDFNSAIQHIVFIIKENRSFDTMFGQFPNALGTTTGQISTGQVLTLGRTPDRNPRDLQHTFEAAITSIDNGKMDQFDLIVKGGACSINGDYLCMTQFTQDDIPNYWSYASAFTLADQMFSSLHGPSFPNHLYSIAAQSGGVLNSPSNKTAPWGCDAPPGDIVQVEDSDGNVTNQFPCFDFQTLGDSLESAGISWKQYAEAGSSWNPFDAINHIRNTSLWTSNVALDSQFIGDAMGTSGNPFPAVSWLVPPGPESDHPIQSACLGENWTVNQINAVMQGPYWDSTAVFVTWDDFGGFYDQYPPAPLDQFGLGPRVPLIIISPYVKPANISHTPYEFSSFLKFAEERYNLPPLTSRDANANDMLDSFDFMQTTLPPLVLTDRHCPPASTTALSFALPQRVGVPSAGMTVFLSNYNSAPITVSGAATSGDFSETNNCPAKLNGYTGGAAVSSCTITVTFTPTAAGTRSGTLTLTDGDSSSPQVVNLSGVGTEVILSPSTLSFGTKTVGVKSAAQTLTVTNHGASVLSITGITAAGDYSQTNTCGSIVMAGGACSVTVIFTPSATGVRYGTISVADSDPSSPQAANLTGKGTLVSLVPTTVNFGNVTVGSTASSDSPKLTNNGTAPLAITNITVTGSSQGYTELTTAEFAVSSNTCGTSLPAQSSCTITVNFTPTMTGSLSGQLWVYDGENDSPQNLALTGTGTAVVQNAAPFISQPLVPASAPPGSAELTLTAQGANFVPGATVSWNGAQLATTFVGSTELQATVPAADLATAGTASVRVEDPSPSGPASNVVLFTVTTPTAGVTVSRSHLTAGTIPRSVVTGDFNGDGRLDCAIANNGDNTVQVFLGNGDGTFRPAISTPVGHGPVSISTGDFNNDGKLDLAVANQGDSTLSILLGNGDGTFNLKTTVNMDAIAPGFIAVADFDADGNLDLAIASKIDSTISIFLGRGDGTFNDENVLPNAGTGPVSLAVGDFNHDGKLDLAVANSGSNNVGILLGNGNGTFIAASTLAAVGRNPAWIEAADFNGDGRLDLAVVSETDNTVSILLGKGDGTFQNQATYATGHAPVALTLGDYNGDGRLDLVVANQTDNTVSFLLGNGDGTFQSQLAAAAGAAPDSVAAGDFNNDGRLDVAVADGTSNAISILTRSSAASLSRDRPGGLPLRLTHLSAATNTSVR